MAMSLTRLLRHLFARPAHGLYPPDSLQRIADAIAEGENRHRGEVCFAVESALPARQALMGRDARHRAAEVFGQLGVWDTAANNGVLVYLLLADHRIEIVADRGLEGRISAEQWRGICQMMEERLKAGEPEAAAVRAVAAVSGLLAEHFPRAAGDPDDNELPDLPRILD
ncbi:TPM domain-containing protein [Luteimonas sp. SX5]|uniref:TPM domain-containing protein n=1 Tax=Luteimonas galliterrae TaxID=2940486 RepID=A0ABT0MHW5_9GAMM|nr:TPM domain-containing protein [Luteimonas galliterrae]MCL1634466.1 TPM domain-containing protein [Luteimonas galliterrae]